MREEDTLTGHPEGVRVTEAGRLEQALLACCASQCWVAGMLSAAPSLTRVCPDDPGSYPDSDALHAVLAASDDVFATLRDDDVREAAEAHRRIGGPDPAHAASNASDAADSASRDAGWSRGEQAGVAGASDETRRALAAGNAAYEQRFGHVFLIRASGRTTEEMLAALRTRLTHDEETERHVVREELRQITRLRLEKLLTPH